MKKHNVVLTLVVLCVGHAHTQTPALSPAASELRLYAMECARMRTNGIIASDPCFLIRHPKGDLMWDLGVPQTMADAPGGVTEMGATQITVSRRLTDMLAELRMTPADVEYISMSHTHFDHVGNSDLFATSVWIVDRDEREWAFRPESLALPTSASVRALEGVPTRLIEGDGDCDVFGDGSVTIIQAPGHTPGHTVLLVRLSHAGPVLLVGDMWNTTAARTARRGTSQAVASMDKVEAIAAETRARVVRHHVLEDVEALPRFPDFLR